MEKAKSPESQVTRSLEKLNLSLNSIEPKFTTNNILSLHSSVLFSGKPRPPTLVSLCLGVVGRHLEDVIDDLGVVSDSFPADITIALAAIARRRKLLNDNVIISLADSSWKILDLSGSDVSDFGLSKVAEICKFIRAVDISRCSNITSLGVSNLVQHCRSLEVLRLGGCPRSESTARKCLGLLKPELEDVEGDSWEELETMEIAHGAPSLRWLIWPKIDKDSLETLSVECPRIIVNPKSSSFGYRGMEIPREAVANEVLDDPFIREVDPETWAVSGFVVKKNPIAMSSPTELPIAEKFRLAFVERDNRLAPKRAKNARQHQRRAERDWVTTSTRAKSIALASQASKRFA